MIYLSRYGRAFFLFYHDEDDDDHCDDHFAMNFTRAIFFSLFSFISSILLFFPLLPIPITSSSYPSPCSLPPAPAILILLYVKR